LGLIGFVQKQYNPQRDSTHVGFTTCVS